MSEPKKHTISALDENQFGVLCRIAGLFSSRGFNIDSLSVGETENPEISRMTIVVKGDDRVLDQVVKQLNRLIDVIKVSDLTGKDFVERELALIKVKAEEATRAEVLRTVDIFRSKVVDVTSKTYTIEVTGTEDKIVAMIDLLRPMGIREIIRTGRVAVPRGD